MTIVHQNANVLLMRAGKILVLIGLLLVMLSALAYFTSPNRSGEQKGELTWATDNNPARSAQVEAFTNLNPDIAFRLDFTTGKPNIIRQISTGLGPDLFDYVLRDQVDYVTGGYLTDITEEAGKMGFSIPNESWPASVDASLYQGRQYGYFSNIGVPILIFNKNVFDDFGVRYPNSLMTWEEFLNLAVKVANPPMHVADEAGVFAVADASFSTYFDSLRGEFFTEEGLPDLTSPEMHEAFQWHKDMIFKYKIIPTRTQLNMMSSQGGWGTGGMEQFCNGHYAMMLGGHWKFIGFAEAYRRQVAEAAKRSDGNEKAFRPLRLGAAMVPYPAGKRPAYPLGARMVGINSKSPRKAEALKFLQYLAGPTYSKQVNHTMDWLPGNPKYASLGLENELPDLCPLELHDMTVKAMEYAYVPRTSPFVDMRSVFAVLATQILLLESDPKCDIDSLLMAAQSQLEGIIRKTLERDEKLAKLYEERVELRRKRTGVN